MSARSPQSRGARGRIQRDLEPMPSKGNIKGRNSEGREAALSNAEEPESCSVSGSGARTPR